jgi:leader peptidase (prepilin peptidase)/N-methyltransferase
MITAASPPLPPPVQHVVYTAFLFVFGSCIGSFLNVVVWRLPRGESLATPPSHCPKCNHPLAWYDNIPVLGWIMLGGRCRYCRDAISIRYPLIEGITGLIFAGYYVLLFIAKLGPRVHPMTSVLWWGFGSMTTLADDWPIYALYMMLLSGLLAISLIDAELFIIPIEIPWLMAGIALVVHAAYSGAARPGALDVSYVGAALAMGGAAGWLISLLLRFTGVLAVSFPDGEPMLEIERQEIEAEIAQARREGRQPDPDLKLPPRFTRRMLHAEISKEVYFLLPPMALAVGCLILSSQWPAAERFFSLVAAIPWSSGLLGSILGLLTGGMVIWLTRIGGTLAFGKVAMGLGDVHLLAAIGAVLGAGPAAMTFFVAPFFGLIVALYALITGRHREIPYGPYLSLAAALVMLFYCPIYAYFLHV